LDSYSTRRASPSGRRFRAIHARSTRHLRASATLASRSSRRDLRGARRRSRGDERVDLPLVVVRRLRLAEARVQIADPIDVGRDELVLAAARALRVAHEVVLHRVAVDGVSRELDAVFVVAPDLVIAKALRVDEVEV